MGDQYRPVVYFTTINCYGGGDLHRKAGDIGDGKDVGWQDFFVFVLFRLGGGGRDIQGIQVPPPTSVGTEAQITYNRKPNYEAPMRTVLRL